MVHKRAGRGIFFLPRQLYSIVNVNPDVRAGRKSAFRGRAISRRSREDAPYSVGFRPACDRIKLNYQIHLRSLGRVLYLIYMRSPRIKLLASSITGKTYKSSSSSSSSFFSPSSLFLLRLHYFYHSGSHQFLNRYIRTLATSFI